MKLNSINGVTERAYYHNAEQQAKNINKEDNTYEANSAYLSTESALAFMGIKTQNKCKIPEYMPQTNSQIGDVTVTVAGGDMTKIKADAYVVPEFTDCVSEGGVGGAIARNGASKGMLEYEKYIEKNGELKNGDYVLTKSWGGNSDYLIHVASIARRDEAFEVTQKCVYNALKLAQEKGLSSVVIPALGTGIIGTLTDSESANAILSGVNKFASEGGKMDVSVVVYNTNKGFQDFSEVLTSKSYEGATPVKGTKKLDPMAFISELAATKPIDREAETAKEELEKKDAELIEQLRKYKGPKGKPLFSDKDIQAIMSNRERFYEEGAEIENFHEKIKAVLRNPEEISSILWCANRSFAVWRAIQDPLNSTIKANPELFKDV